MELDLTGLVLPQRIEVVERSEDERVAEFGVAQDVTGGDALDSVAPREEGSLGALAGPGSPEKDQPHRLRLTPCTAGARGTERGPSS